MCDAMKLLKPGIAYFFVNLSMKQMLEIQNAGTEAVKKLRLKKLKSGLPFMINSKDLPGNQCYLEFPDGLIKLVVVQKSAKDFTEIRILSFEEVETLRAKYNLPYS